MSIHRSYRTRRLAAIEMAAFVLGAAGCGAGGGGAKRDDGVRAGSAGAGAAGSSDQLFGSGGADSLDTVRSRDDAGCNRLDVGFEELNPTVVLLIDRSGSMWDYGYGSSSTRWDALRDTLMNPSGPIATLQDKVRWGFLAYTTNGATCPLLESVDVGFGRFDSIRERYDALSDRPEFKADTPTGAGVEAAAQTLAAFNEPGPKYIILATDGEPDRCDLHDPNCGQDASIRAVQDAYAAGIETFVIGIGNDVGAQHLSDIANAGSGQPVRRSLTPGCEDLATDTATYSASSGTATFYRPSDPAELERDLVDIVGSVRKCQFDLSAEVDLERADEGNVMLDGQPLGFDDPNGWRMVTPMRLEVLGTACERILSDSRRLSVGFPCGVATVIR